MAKGETILANIKPAPSLKEMAFKAIKEAIMFYQLKPGTLYKEQAIASELGISKTPVREALLELAARGFVTFFPRKGFEINELNEKSIRDLIELRIVLETAVVRNITPDITAESIQVLDNILRREKEIVTSRNRKQVRKLNRELHGFLASLTQNKYLISSLENITDLTEWVVALTMELEDAPQIALREHTAIISKIKQHDTEGAVAMIQAHLSQIVDRIIAGKRLRGEADDSMN